jgi:hypothetical protein
MPPELLSILKHQSLIYISHLTFRVFERVLEADLGQLN